MHVGKSSRKFKRRSMPSVSSINFDAKCADIAEQAIYKVLSVAVDILWNDFGGLQKRNERLKFFSDAFRYKLEHIDEGLTPEQEEAMKAFEDQTSYRIVFDK